MVTYRIAIGKIVFFRTQEFTSFPPNVDKTRPWIPEIVQHAVTYTDADIPRVRITDHDSYYEFQLPWNDRGLTRLAVCKEDVQVTS